jgi:hypothetical protein
MDESNWVKELLTQTWDLKSGNRTFGYKTIDALGVQLKNRSGLFHSHAPRLSAKLVEHTDGGDRSSLFVY